MKCANCGAELKVGCVYCSVCGKEAQIVPDYNLLDDELLKPFIEEPKRHHRTKSRKETSDTHSAKEKQRTSEQKNTKKTMCILLILCAAIIVCVFGAIKISHNHSYAYQYKTGCENITKKEYQKAIHSLKRAIELNPESTDAYTALGDAYSGAKDTKHAVNAYQNAIELDAECESAYQGLTDLYESEQAFAQIQALLEEASEQIKDNVLSDYVIETPQADASGASYSDDFVLHFTASESLDIYYTTDQSSPIENGTLYSDTTGIELTEGTHVIKAVCKDNRGLYSEIVTEEYTIAYDLPDMPVVSPDGGTFESEQQISVMVPEGGTAYYTWDKTVPTSASTPYSGPITVIPGNNVLSVIIIDRHGNVSPVYRGNYVYMP